MLFSKLLGGTCFVFINPYKPQLLLVKDTNGKVRFYMGYDLANEIDIDLNTDVQPVILKPQKTI